MTFGRHQAVNPEIILLLLRRRNGIIILLLLIDGITQSKRVSSYPVAVLALANGKVDCC